MGLPKLLLVPFEIFQVLSVTQRVLRWLDQDNILEYPMTEYYKKMDMWIPVYHDLY